MIKFVPMGRETQTRRENLVVEAVDPKTGKRFDVTISQTKLLAVSRRSKGQVKEAAFVVPRVLQRPNAVFEGLSREEDEPREAYGWRCYCGTPDTAYREDGEEIGRWIGEVFLIFVDNEKVAYNWYWDEEDPENPGLPIDFATRFRERLL